MAESIKQRIHNTVSAVLAEKLTEPVRKNGIQAVQVENPSSILPQEPAKVEEQNVINAEVTVNVQPRNDVPEAFIAHSP